MNSVKSEFIAKLLAEKSAEAQTCGHSGACRARPCATPGN